MNPLTDNRRHITRRALFAKTATGIGTAALAYLLRNEAFGAPATTTAATQMAAIGALPGLPHFAPKAKRVVYMFQNGAPSHVDLFDFKPKLREWQGKEIPPELLGKQTAVDDDVGAKSETGFGGDHEVFAAWEFRRLGQRFSAADRGDRG